MLQRTKGFLPKNNHLIVKNWGQKKEPLYLPALNSESYSFNNKNSHSKDVKVYKKSERNCSYNEWHKSYAEDKNNNNKNKKVNMANKMPFEGILAKEKRKRRR